MWLENTSLHSLFYEIRTILQQASWIFYVIDHTSVPVTLTHIHKATVHPAYTLLPSTTLHIRCPQCQHSFRPTETQGGLAHEDEHGHQHGDQHAERHGDQQRDQAHEI